MQLLHAVGRISERLISGSPQLVSSSVKQDKVHAHLPPRAAAWLKGGSAYEHFVNHEVWSVEPIITQDYAHIMRCSPSFPMSVCLL